MSRNARNGEDEDWWKFEWDVKRRPVASIIDEKGKLDKNGKSGVKWGIWRTFARGLAKIQNEISSWHAPC